MKTLSLPVAAILIALATVSRADMPILQLPQLPQIPQPLSPQIIPNPLPILCPDLRVTVSSEMVLPNYRIRTTVRVQNVGNTNYVSNHGQQRVRVQVAHGWVNEDFTYAFTNVPQGSSRSWSFERDREGAPLNTQAQVVFAPSVYADGNPFNNECNAANNSAATQL